MGNSFVGASVNDKTYFFNSFAHAIPNEFHKLGIDMYLTNSVKEKEPSSNPTKTPSIINILGHSIEFLHNNMNQFGESSMSHIACVLQHKTKQVSDLYILAKILGQV